MGTSALAAVLAACSLVGRPTDCVEPLAHSDQAVKDTVAELRTQCAGVHSAGACYYRHTSNVTQPAAWSTCGANNGRPAHVHTVALLRLLLGHSILSGGERAWLGAKALPAAGGQAMYTAHWVERADATNGHSVSGRVFAPSNYTNATVAVALDTGDFTLVAVDDRRPLPVICEQRAPPTTPRYPAYMDTFHLIYTGRALGAGATELAPPAAGSAALPACAYACLKRDGCEYFTHRSVTGDCKLYAAGDIAAALVDDDGSAVYSRFGYDTDVCPPKWPALANGGTVRLTAGLHTERWAAPGAVASFACPNGTTLKERPSDEVHNATCKGGEWDADFARIQCTPVCIAPSAPADGSALNSDKAPLQLGTNSVYMLQAVLTRSCADGDYLSRLPFVQSESATCGNDSRWGSDVTADECVTPCETLDVDFGDTVSVDYNGTKNGQWDAYAVGTGLAVRCAPNTTADDYASHSMRFTCIKNGTWDDAREHTCEPKPRLWLLRVITTATSDSAKWEEWRPQLGARRIADTAEFGGTGGAQPEAVIGALDHTVYVIQPHNRNVFKVEPDGHAVTQLDSVPSTYHTADVAAGAMVDRAGTLLVCGGVPVGSPKPWLAPAYTHCYTHNPLTGASAPAAALPRDKHYFGICTYSGGDSGSGSGAVAAGGLGSDTSAFAYDAAADAWRALPNTQARHYIANCAEHMQMVYVCGSGYPFHAVCERYDGTRWSYAASLPGPRSHGRLVELGSVLYYTGGLLVDGDNNRHHYKEVLALNHSAGGWQRGPDTLAAFTRHMAVAVDY